MGAFTDPASRGSWWRLLVAAVMLALLWRLRQPLLLLFGGLLVASALRALAAPLVERVRLSPRAAVLTTVAVLLLLLGLGAWALGGELSSQLGDLRGQLPAAWQALREWLLGMPFGARVLAWVEDLNAPEALWAEVAGVAAGTAHLLSALVLIVLLGVYVALDAHDYHRRVVRLVPPAQRPRFDEALCASGEALKRWLLGQAVTMVVVGVAVAVGLTVLDVPLALALGLISGLLEFVPFFGPIVSGVLAVLVAFAQGPSQALWVALMFLAVQQVEGNVLTPLVQRWAVRLPPALGISGVVVLGALLGLPGVVFGTPLVVVAMVLVRKLYIEPMEASP